MIGLPRAVCCFCGEPAKSWSLWFDYAGRPRYICERHREISESERNRLLITGGKPPW